MSDIMKLTWEEIKEQPWNIVKKIEKIVRGDEKANDVKFRYINSGGSGRFSSFRFGGISIETDDENYKTVHRRVKVISTKDREYEIDLNKIKAKYEEIKKLALEFETNRKRIDKKREENKNLITKLKGNTKNINIDISGNYFTVEIWDLNEEKVKKVVEFAKTL